VNKFTWQDVQLEVVLDSTASVEPEFEVGEYSVDEVLVGGPEEGSGLGGIFGFFDSGMFVGIFGVSVVGVSPFVLPTKIVRVAVVVGDFIILDRVDQTSNCCSCGKHSIQKLYEL
jgi:hypothetical protein